MADFARSDHPAVQAQLDRLAALSPGGDRLGLHRISRLLDRLGRPQDALPPVFHVAGTNGKGSTCAFLRAALEAAGHRVHVFTSPHLVRFNERIRLAGQLIEDEPLAGLLAEVLDAGGDIEPSFFEATTAAALLAFARTPAGATILEVGLGGRLDATNVIERPLVCGIAGLGLDHQQFLGRSLKAIAGEKAGIAKRRVPLVTQRYPRTLTAEIERLANAAGAPWLPRGGKWDARVGRERLVYRDAAGTLELPVPALHGKHQAANAALAVAMLRHQDQIGVQPSALAAAMRHARWPARMQRLREGPLVGRREVWIDGGHNPAAARSVAATIDKQFTDGRPMTLLFASLSNKDPVGMLKPFRGIVSEVMTLAIRDHDCRSPEELAHIARGLGFTARPAASLEAAMRNSAADNRTLVFGSLYLAGEALAANRETVD